MATASILEMTDKRTSDKQKALDSALAQDVVFMPGEPFFVDPEQNLGYLRLNFSHVAPERLDEGVRRLAGVIREALLVEAA